MPDKLKNNRNILLVANWESNVGYAWWLMENFWITIAEHFSDRNIFLIYPVITEIPQSITASNIKHSELNFSDHSLSNLWHIYRYIKENSIRYIYLSDNPTYSWFYILLRLWGVRKIVVHDHTPGERTKPVGLKKTLKFFLQRVPFYTADHVIAVTPFVHQRHLTVNCIPKNKCSYASNGIKPFNLGKTDANYAHQQFNIAKGRHIVVTTGRASYYKGIDFYLRCANELINVQRETNFHFLFCGDGPDMDDFKKLCTDLSLDEYFTFAGKRSDIRNILPSCHIGLHTSKGEVGYSLSILEYMSAGLATIVPDNPSTSCATINAETGLLYRQRDINSACNNIKLCLDDKLAKHLSRNAIKEITEKYSITKTNTKLTSILKNIYL